MFLEEAKKAIELQYNIDLIMSNQTPVLVKLDTMPDNKVIIEDNVREILNNLAITTRVDNKEIGFIIYGKEYEHNHVLLNSIEISDGDLSSFKVNFGNKITENLKTVIDENLDQKTVVVHGHTHPQITEFYEYFSLGDLSSYMEFTYNIDDFKNKNTQLIGMILLPDGRIKIAYYNPADNRFYKMDNIN